MMAPDARPAGESSEARPLGTRSGREAAAGVFDVAISFSSHDPLAADLASELQARLRRRGLRVYFFRDRDEAAAALGERLSEVLPAVFQHRSRIVVLVGSANYGQTPWTRVELAAALARPQDEDGRPRLVPISADGTRIAEIPEDVIQASLGAQSPSEMAQIVDLLCRRLGSRRKGLERLGWGAVAGIAILAAASSLELAGIAAATRRILATLGWLAGSWALIAAIVPRFWMARRRRQAGQALRVITEGPHLSRARAGLRFCGWLISILALASAVGATRDAISTRLAARDIRVLLEEDNLGAGLSRMEANRETLADYWEDLLSETRRRWQRGVAGGRWQEMAALYPALVRCSGGRDAALESALWTSSGIERLTPGAAVTDWLSAAEAVAPAAPDLGRKMFETVLARELEQAMYGNDFYYGFDGARAWAIYRRLKDPAGRDRWVKENGVSRLPNNLGLAGRLAVFQAAHGDGEAEARVLASLATPEPDSGTLEEISITPLSGALRARLETPLTAAWARIHGDDAPHSVGFVLGKALGSIDRLLTNRLLFASASSPNEQERAHAIHGLGILAHHGSDADQKKKARARVRTARRDPSWLVSFAAKEAEMGQPRCVDGLGLSAEERLREWLLAGAKAEGREGMRTSLSPYRDFCREAVDPLLIAEAEAAMGQRSATRQDIAADFTALRRAYEALGSPPGAASEAGSHVAALRAFGATHDPAAAAYLEKIFDTLAHGNMRIAAAESLLLLRGHFGPMILGEFDSLTQMPSSIYRADVVDLLERQATRVAALPANEQRELIRILAQISNTGEASERGRALDVLITLDRRTAWSEAKRLASSSRTEDRLEGYERLVDLWPGPGSTTPGPRPAS